MSVLMVRNRSIASLAALFLVGALLPGCGGGGDPGPQRFDVSGKVTFKGQPIPFGTIQFLPDSSKGNQGPAGFATIENGEFNTQNGGKGSVGGPHRVIITGADGPPALTDDDTGGSPLFPDYRTEHDLPRQTATADFDVPAAQANAAPGVSDS